MKGTMGGGAIRYTRMKCTIGGGGVYPYEGDHGGDTRMKGTMGGGAIRYTRMKGTIGGGGIPV